MVLLMDPGNHWGTLKVLHIKQQNPPPPRQSIFQLTSKGSL